MVMSAENVASPPAEPLSVETLLLEVQALSTKLAERGAALGGLKAEIAEKVVREVQGAITAQTVSIIGREVAHRFEQELDKRVIAAVADLLPAVMRAHALVPLADVTEAVERAVDASISRRLAQLIGGGELHIGLKRA